MPCILGMSANLTENEKALMRVIRDDEYRDGDLTQPVWSHNLEVPAGMTRRGMGGVFSSLQEKGFIRLEGRGKESTVAFTEKGIDTLKALEG